MYSLKLIARPAAILMKSTLLMGLLAATSVTTAYEASAAGGCPTGMTRYHGRCMTYVHRRHLILAAQKNAAKTCPVQLPVTGQVVNMPCPADPAPATKTCPFQMPVTGQIVNVPC